MRLFLSSCVLRMTAFYMISRSCSSVDCGRHNYPLSSLPAAHIAGAQHRLHLRSPAGGRYSCGIAAQSSIMYSSAILITEDHWSSGSLAVVLSLAKKHVDDDKY